MGASVLRIVRWGAVGVLILTIQPPGFSQEAGEDRSKAWVDLYQPHADDEMPYRLMKPLGFDGSKSYPVIVSLHGGGGRGTDNRKQLRNWNEPLAQAQTRSNYPSYVLAPQATRLWDASHLEKIKEIVAELPSVDMNRIYVLGQLNGRTRDLHPAADRSPLLRGRGAIRRDRPARL